MAAFINEVMLGGRGSIESAKQAVSGGVNYHKPVVYCTGDPWKIAIRFAKHIHAMYARGIWLPDNVMILAGSIKRASEKSPLKRLEQELVRLGVPVHTPPEDESEVSEEVSAGKVIFCTFHQSKGLERRAIFVVGFNNDYFVHFAKRADPL